MYTMKHIKVKRAISQRGLGLIEVLIAVMSTALMLTAVAILLSMSVANSAEARYRELATDRSQEVIEHLRRYRIIEGWDVFWNYLDSTGEPDMAGNDMFCLTDENFDPPGMEWMPDWPVTGCEYQQDTYSKANIKRILTVSIDRTNNPPTALTATVETFWKVGTQEKSVKLEQRFTMYQ